MAANRTRLVLIGSLAALAMMLVVTTLAVIAYRDMQRQFAVHVLLSVGTLLDVAGALPTGPEYGATISPIVANAVVRDTFVLKAIGPNVRELPSAQALEVLCRLVGEEGRGVLKSSDIVAAGVDVETYLDSLQAGVMDEVRRVQRSLGGSGCKLAGANRPSVGE